MFTCEPALYVHGTKVRTTTLSYIFLVFDQLTLRAGLVSQHYLLNKRTTRTTQECSPPSHREYDHLYHSISSDTGLFGTTARAT